MSSFFVKFWLVLKYGRLGLAWWFWSTFYRATLCLHPAFSIAVPMRISGWMRLDVDPRGKVQVGRNVRINSGSLVNAVGGHRRTIIAVHRGATLSIGNDTGLSNCTIVCQQEIRIGDRVFIGGGVFIVDSDLHGLKPEDRIPHRADRVVRALVTIEDEAFIGAHAIILKGVTIGRAAVIGAGSVVAKSVPAGEIWAGNPARPVGRVRE